MTVAENLEMGAHLRDDEGIDETRERVHTLFPRLYDRRAQLAGTLSGGEQQMLAMGRALMSRPRLLLMDEPSMGLSPALVEQNFEIIREVNATGVAVLVVEQNANMALSIADRGYVLQTGVIALADKARPSSRATTSSARTSAVDDGRGQPGERAPCVFVVPRRLGSRPRPALEIEDGEVVELHVPDASRDQIGEALRRRRPRPRSTST